jgi:hypothetical protein
MMPTALSIASDKFKTRTAGVKAKLEKQSAGFNKKHAPAKEKLDTASAPKKEKAAVKKGGSKFGKGNGQYTQHNGKKMANVTAEQLKASGLSLRSYMNKWKSSGKRP